ALPSTGHCIMIKPRPISNCISFQRTLIVSCRDSFAKEFRAMLGPARASSLLIAKSVEQTLQIARAVSIGCIILDDGAPSFTSYDVAQEIRRGLSWPQKAVP